MAAAAAAAALDGGSLACRTLLDVGQIGLAVLGTVALLVAAAAAAPGASFSGQAGQTGA